MIGAVKAHLQRRATVRQGGPCPWKSLRTWPSNADAPLRQAVLIGTRRLVPHGVLDDVSVHRARRSPPRNERFPGVGGPDNCHTVMILNASTTQSVLWGVGAPGGAITPGTNGMTLLPASGQTLAVQTLPHRSLLDQAQIAASGLIFDVPGGGVVPQVIQISYLCTLGEAG